MLFLNFVSFAAFSFLPEQASHWAKEVDGVFFFISALCTILFFLVEGALVWLVLKYRRRKNEADKKTPFITHNTRLEIVWTIIPSVLMLIVFYYGTVSFYKMRTIPQNAKQIEVTGKQWSWKFSYSNGVSVSTQSTCSDASLKSKYDCERKGHRWRQGEKLVVPVNQQIKMRMSSLDVIHSLYIPAFRVKQDVVPGITSYLWFIAIKPGLYDIFCTEYCGLDHSGMIGKVEVKTIPEFEAWLTSAKEEQKKLETLVQTPEELAKMGAELFKVKKGCVACHRLNGERLVGPPLNDLYGKKEILTSGKQITVDENYLTESITSPGAKVVRGDPPYPPMNAQDVNENEVKALVEFLKACKGIDCGG